MSFYRTVLAALLALAVAVAPVGSALAAGHAADKPTMDDCHGQAPDNHACCDTKAMCPDACGATCCKLMGMIVELPVMDAAAFVSLEVADPLKPPDWQLRPRLPPPRT
jgi:hypothetical protein